MLRIAHLVNPIHAPGSSDLVVAQHVTFESMRVAKTFAEGVCEVRLLAAGHPEDRKIVPAWFDPAPDLDRSVLDIASFEQPRKLPLVCDLLDRLMTAAPDSDLFVFTNVDIALMPNFYRSIAEIYRSGIDGFVVNRRTITDRWSDPADLPLMYAEVGVPHPGRDCFIFTPQALRSFDLGDIIVGADNVGRMILWNIALASEQFRWFKDLHLTFHLGDDAGWRNPDFVDYHEFNNREGRELLERLELRHGPLRNRLPFSETLPRPEGHWIRWKRYQVGDLTPYERIRRRLGLLRDRLAGR